MPSPKTSEQALYIYVSESLRNSLTSLKTKSKLTYRKLTRRMIEEVSANERLEEAIRSYLLDHMSADSNQTIKIRICQDDETLALASALAFRICGTGSISEVCRVIIRYYVDHALVHGLMYSLKAAPKKVVAVADKSPSTIVQFVDRSLAKKKSNARGADEGVEYIATSFNLDTETVDLLAELVKTMHIKYLALMSELIEQYMADDVRYKILSESDVLLEDPPSTKSIVVKRFNFTTEVNALLEALCENVLASSNKSAMIRALIKAEAELQGLRGKKRISRRLPRARGRQFARSSK